MVSRAIESGCGLREARILLSISLSIPGFSKASKAVWRNAPLSRQGLPLTTCFHLPSEAIRIFTSLSTISLIAFLLLAFIAFAFHNIYADGFIFDLPDYIFASCFFIISTYLLTHPSIFAGLPFIKYKETASTLILNQVDYVAYIEQDYSTEIRIILDYFETQKPYLKKGLNISQVAVEINISSKLISFIINQHFEMRFNEFINKYRVSYIKEKINENYLDSFTLNSLASEAGFSNQTTFIAAFKKNEKFTPSEYLLNLKL